MIKPNIILNELTSDNYFKEETSKKQIVVHHTAGGGNAKNVIHGWNFKIDKIATAFVIDDAGSIYQAFAPKYWAYHIAFSKNTNKVPAIYHDFKKEVEIAQASIGIEICNWGQLVKGDDGKFRNYVNGIVPDDQVYEFADKFRGFKYYHKYNDKQLASLKSLLQWLCYEFKIYNGYDDKIWNIDESALNGDNGIFTHVSYRSDKNDCSPQINLINTLKSI